MTPEEENRRPCVSKQVQNNNAQQVSCTMLHFSLVEADHLDFFFSGLCNPNRVACIQLGTLELDYL